jgi:hypothetical protein
VTTDAQNQATLDVSYPPLPLSSNTYMAHPPGPWMHLAPTVDDEAVHGGNGVRGWRLRAPHLLG